MINIKDIIEKYKNNDKVIYINILKDAYHIPIKAMIIIDSTKDNFITFDNKREKENKYTINYNEIENLKEKLNNKELYENKDTINPHVLDGTINEIYMKSNSNSIELNMYNIGYWENENMIINYTENEFNTKESKQYTFELLKIIKEIEKIMRNNHIKFNISK